MVVQVNIKRFYLLIFLKIVAGGIALITLAGYNYLNVSNNYFTQNYGTMGGVYFFSIFAPAKIILTNNIYVANFGYDAEKHIGAGSVVQLAMKGPYFPAILSKNNKYISNIGEVRGTIITFSGAFSEEESIFSSKFIIIQI